MMKKGDMLSIALIIANIVLIGLFVAKGAITTTGTFSGADTAALEPGPVPTIAPSATITPSSTPTPSPTMVLAVNEGALLFATIRYTPTQSPPAAPVTPTVAPTPTPVPDKKYIAAPTSMPQPSYKAKKAKPSIPAYKAISWPEPKYHK